MKFTEEQYSEIEELAGLNYTVRQIALYLDVKVILLDAEMDLPDSPFRYHFERGQLIAQAFIDRANLDSAKKGNITAMMRYDKKVKENKQRQAKERIFGRS